ncbi:MAG: TetR/AcrR family transcriptional regulator [Pirellulaceae bacterium]|nr:TetR/AcrR family transcriptional regulator [Pirellulaceae bacterium]
MRQIARQAKVSGGTLHYHFPSKSELVETMVAETVKDLKNQAREILDAGGHPRDQLGRITRLFFAAFDRDWNRYYVALLLGDELRAIRPDDFPTTSDLFVELARKGQRGGDVRRGDPVLLGILCHGMLLRTARGRAFGELKRPLSPRADEVAAACWRVLEK